MKNMTLISALAACSLASAATLTWQGGDGSWSDSNWNEDGTTNQTASTIIASGDMVNIAGGTVDAGAANITANGSLTISGNASITNGGTITRGTSNAHILINTSGTINLTDIITGGSSASSTFTFQSGNIILSEDNAIATGGASLDNSMRFNLTGETNSFTLTQTGLGGAPVKQLFGKVNTGFFAIDGTKVSGSLNPKAGGFTWDAVNIEALNTELAGQAVNGRCLQISNQITSHKVTLVAANDGGGEGPERPAAATGPNVIFILSDDQGWTDHSVAVMAQDLQSDYYQTPYLQQLADEGVCFTSTYAQPNCAPSRAALLSGQYSCRDGNGVYNVWELNRQGNRTTYTSPADQIDEWADGSTNSTTVAEALWDAGYVTAHFGKYHIGSANTSHGTHPLNQGYDYNYGGKDVGNPGTFWASGGTFHGNVGPELDPFAANYTGEYVTNNLMPVANGNDPTTLIGTTKHLTDAMGDAFVSFMNDHQSGSLSNYPVYVQFNFYAVHTPIQTRSDLKAKYDALSPGTHHTNSKYAGLLENMDQTIGRMLNYLNDPDGDGNTADSMTENTLVIFTSDNGGHMGDTSNLPLRGRKGMHYQGGVRVPMIMRMPGTLPAGKVSDTLVHFVDMYPTMLDAMSVTHPDPAQHKLDGESLWAHALDPDNTERARDPIFYHFPGYMDSRTYACSAVVAEINGKRYKYIYAYDPYYDPGNDTSTGNTTRGFDQYQLYNLTDDIEESINLMDYIDVAKRAEPEPHDLSDSREYWDYILYKSVANQMAALLNNWLVGEPTDTTWNPIHVTYKSNYPDIDPGLVGTTVAPAPEALPEIEIPSNQVFQIQSHELSNSNNVSMSFNSESGFQYRVVGSTNLLDWETVTNLTASSALTSLLFEGEPDSYFYRIVLHND